MLNRVLVESCQTVNHGCRSWDDVVGRQRPATEVCHKYQPAACHGYGYRGRTRGFRILHVFSSGKNKKGKKRKERKDKGMAVFSRIEVSKVCELQEELSTRLGPVGKADSDPGNALRHKPSYHSTDQVCVMGKV